MLLEQDFSNEITLFKSPCADLMIKRFDTLVQYKKEDSDMDIHEGQTGTASGYEGEHTNI